MEALEEKTEGRRVNEDRRTRRSHEKSSRTAEGEKVRSLGFSFGLHLEICRRLSWQRRKALQQGQSLSLTEEIRTRREEISSSRERMTRMNETSKTSAYTHKNDVRLPLPLFYSSAIHTLSLHYISPETYTDRNKERVRVS